MKIHITKKGAQKLLTAAVKRKGKKHVAYCVYYDTNNQSRCIVGEALSCAGLSDAVLASLRNDGIRSQRVLEELAANGVTFTAGANKVFAEAQEVQDYRRQWGDALAAARRA